MSAQADSGSHDPMKLGVLRDILKGVPARDRDHDITDYFERFITPKLPFTPTAKTPLHATLRVLLIGTSDEGSPFAKLAGHDVLELIWHFVRQEWAWRFFAEQRVRRAPKVNDRSSIAFAHVEDVPRLVSTAHAHVRRDTTVTRHCPCSGRGASFKGAAHGRREPDYCPC